jgi:hypothetical protein
MILKEGGCEAGPLFNGLKRRCGFAASIAENMDENAIRKNIDIVIKWAKDHHVKTRQSEFLKMFPNAPIDEDDGILCIRPCNVDESIGCTNEKGCDGCRRKYWLTEVTDNEN